VCRHGRARDQSELGLIVERSCYYVQVFGPSCSADAACIFYSCLPLSCKDGFSPSLIYKGRVGCGHWCRAGVLTFDGRGYPFGVLGLRLGLTIGASTNRLVGRAAYLTRLGDFAGTYTSVGGGAALAGGIGRVQLENDGGVIITLGGGKAGLEFSANLSSTEITLE
jgi:hypothetical protein